MSVEWHAPATLDGALALRAERPDLTVVAGGTFVGVLVNQRLLAPAGFLSLGSIPDLDGLSEEHGELRLGAMTTHRAVETSELVRDAWPALAAAFGAVASPRIRMRATVGGVLADADYASDPPSMLIALGGRAIVASVRGRREIPLERFVLGHYLTELAADELIVGVRVPGGRHRAAYRKLRTRSHEDRPCVGVAVCRREDDLRVVVGAVSDRPRYFPELCSGEPGAIARAYADAIDPIDDVSGSSAYRRRVIAVEINRALEAIA